MSDRNNQETNNDMAVVLGIGAVALGVTAATVAIVNAQENKPATNSLRQDDDAEESSGINWGRVFSTIGSIATAMVADGANDLSRPSLPSSQQKNCCDICSKTMWGPTRTLSCNHIFHTACIQKWKETSRRCPTCGSLVLL